MAGKTKSIGKAFKNRMGPGLEKHANQKDGKAPGRPAKLGGDVIGPVKTKHASQKGK